MTRTRNDKLKNLIRPGTHASEDEQVNNVLALSNQYLWALVLVFAAASIIFRVKRDEEVKAAEARAEAAEKQEEKTQKAQIILKGQLAQQEKEAGKLKDQLAQQETESGKLKDQLSQTELVVVELKAKHQDAQALLTAIEGSKDMERFEQQQKQLLSIQRQRMLKTLDEFQAKLREDLGLGLFLDRGPAQLQQLSTLLLGGKISQDTIGARFASGCRLAQTGFGSSERAAELGKKWEQEALHQLGFSVSERPQTVRQEAVIDPEDQVWFRTIIFQRLSGVESEARKLHESARGVMFVHYREHSDQIGDVAIQALLDRFEELLTKDLAAVTPAERTRLEKEGLELPGKLAAALQQYVIGIFDQSGAPLLR